MTFHLVEHQEPCPPEFSDADWRAYGPLELRALTDEGVVAGYLKWHQVLDGEPIPSIVKLSTYWGFERQGVASALFDEFLRRHPTGEVYLGTFLHDGRLWWSAYRHRRDLDRSRFTLQEGEEDPMDPNRTLEDLRTALREVTNGKQHLDELGNTFRDSREEQAQLREDIALKQDQVGELVEALDEWLSKGGFLPDDWNVRRTSTLNEAGLEAATSVVAEALQGDYASTADIAKIAVEEYLRNVA